MKIGDGESAPLNPNAMGMNKSDNFDLLTRSLGSVLR